MSPELPQEETPLPLGDSKVPQVPTRESTLSAGMYMRARLAVEIIDTNLCMCCRNYSDTMYIAIIFTLIHKN